MQDIIFVLQWWAVFLIIGLIFLPLSFYIFNNFQDKGYIFSKIIGIAFISYSVFILGIFKISKFTTLTIFLTLAFLFLVNLFIYKKSETLKSFKNKIPLIIFEELIFLSGIFYWSFVRGNEPSIHGLEKFMDFGFINSILRAEFFPPKDMWFAGSSINYYYFGHYITALLTKLSHIPSNITFNLMLATIFAFTFSATFSIIINLVAKNITKNKLKIFLSGLLGAFLMSLAGNIHTIYAFFSSYNVDNPKPFWELLFFPSNFPNNYWYPNATRFIPNTIHEFPIYSFVVADLHGHVLDIPFVLLTIALIYSMYLDNGFGKIKIFLLSFLLSIMYMTNVWDGIIYLLLGISTILIVNLGVLKITVGKVKHSQHQKFKNYFNRIQNLDIFITRSIKYFLSILLVFLIFTFPFSLHFKPFVSGIGIICSPGFLVKIGKIGPFLFEANHCQRSTYWEFLVLYGLFYFFVFYFMYFVFKKKQELNNIDIFVLILILLSTILIIIPELIYIKDIYPTHYRANTMFKLVYQSFILLTLTSVYIFVRIANFKKNLPFYLISIILFGLALYYSKFAIRSYYGDLNKYSGLNGTAYLKNLYPDDYAAINWINKNIPNQPVMLEAQGDSYTDYERISANTGLPTVLGWTVHEWLWRGTYEMMIPRIEDVKAVYEAKSMQDILPIVKKYDIKYIYLGKLEKEKYPNLNENNFNQIGKIIYLTGDTRIYKLNDY